MSSPEGNPQEFPLVSVVMGVYNAGNYLDAAVRSILEQEYPNFEFIVIDDGSTDDSFAKLQRYVVEFPQLRLIQQQNRGPAAARNTGIKAAVGKYIAIMDADDISDQMRLQKQVKFLEEHPECMVVGCQLEMIDPDGETISDESGRPTEHAEILKFMMTGLGGIPNPAAMIRGDVLKQVGGYDEEYPAAEDLDLWFRISEHGQLANLPETLHQYRLHESSHGTTKLNLQNEWGKRAVLSYFERKGEQPPKTLRFNLPKPMSRAEQRMNWAWMAVNSNNRRGSLKHAGAAVRLEPTNLRLWYQCLRIRLGLTHSFRRREGSS